MQPFVVDHVAAALRTARAQVTLERTEHGHRYVERPLARLAFYVPPWARAAMYEAGWVVVV